jgi:Zn-finger nucleic acid-binding protein
LEKLVYKSVSNSRTPTTLAADTVRVGQHRSSNDFEDSDFCDGKYHQRARKKSWLSEIFD